MSPAAKRTPRTRSTRYVLPASCLYFRCFGATPLEQEDEPDSRWLHAPGCGDSGYHQL